MSSREWSGAASPMTSPSRAVCSPPTWTTSTSPLARSPTSCWRSPVLWPTKVHPSPARPTCESICSPWCLPHCLKRRAGWFPIPTRYGISQRPAWSGAPPLGGAPSSRTETMERNRPPQRRGWSGQRGAAPAPRQRPAQRDRPPPRRAGARRPKPHLGVGTLFGGGLAAAAAEGAGGGATVARHPDPSRHSPPGGRGPGRYGRAGPGIAGPRRCGASLGRSRRSRAHPRSVAPGRGDRNPGLFL